LNWAQAKVAEYLEAPAGASLQLVPIIARACSSIVNLQYSITSPSTCQAAQYKELKPKGEQGMIIE